MTGLTNADIASWMASGGVIGRSRERVAQTGDAFMLPDHCKHPPWGIVQTPEGDVICWGCGCRPPKTLDINKRGT